MAESTPNDPTTTQPGDTPGLTGPEPAAPPAAGPKPPRARNTAPAQGSPTPGLVEGPRPPGEGLTVGRIVHFVTPEGLDRPAIVTDVVQKKAGKVSLSVFQARKDFPKNQHPGPILMLDSVEYDATDKKAGTWHWPEGVR